MSDAPLSSPTDSDGGPHLFPNVAPMTNEQRQEEIGRLQNSREFFTTFSDRLHPQYPDAKRHWEELHQPAPAPVRAPVGTNGQQPQAPAASTYPADISRPFDVTTLPDDRKREIIRALQANMPPAMADRSHGDHPAWSRMWSELHNFSASQDDMEAGGPLSLDHASMLTGNMVSFTVAQIEGQALSLDDMREAQQAVASSMVALNASKSDASWLAATLNGAISRAKEGISTEQGMARLNEKHGEAGARQKVSDAVGVLMHLEAAGIPALEGLTRLGIASDPDLITELAKYAGRLPALRSALALAGKGNPSR